ncbi:hypothetical protein HYT59_00600 [Candidatus Woesebacteria bacterium]|nr:hypothetical protein [Candidatus Woesebacteria bacterium]
MVEGSKAEFWECLAPPLMESVELNEFEEIIHENSLTLEQFRDYRNSNPFAKFITFGISVLNGGPLKDISEELELIHYKKAVEMFTKACPQLLPKLSFVVFFQMITAHFLDKGYHLVMMLPPKRLFTYPNAYYTSHEVRHLITDKLNKFADQITFVTGLYREE